MSDCIIGIGGTGAKCLEAITRLAATGLFSSQHAITTLFVDPDRSNGSLGRAQEAVRDYIQCRPALGPQNLADPGMLAARFESTLPEVWTPFGDRLDPTLQDFFDANRLADQNPGAAMLLKTLYDPEELSTNLKEGFLGHPAIGAAVLAQKIDLTDDEFWRSLVQRVMVNAGQERKPRILLLGSIFGGTGASGLPTLARLLRTELGSRVELAAVLALPYFKFREIENEGMAARSDEFLQNTQAALKYYAHQRFDENLDAIYVLGDQEPKDVTENKQPRKGGQQQRNDPHFVELYAALAALDFFHDEPRPAAVGRYHLIARRDTGELAWEDLPARAAGGTGGLKKAVEQFTRFAFAYRTLFGPAIEQIRTGTVGVYTAPWYVNFFVRRGVRLNDDGDKKLLAATQRLCDGFLTWLANVQASAREPSGKRLEGLLVNYQPFARRTEPEDDHGDKNGTLPGRLLKSPDATGVNDFARLFPTPSPTAPGSLGQLWEEMCNASVVSSNKPLGDFLRELHARCA